LIVNKTPLSLARPNMHGRRPKPPVMDSS
jgi:hypothetical protein